MLRLLASTREQLHALPAHELLGFNIDRRMSEEQARASLYLAIDTFDEQRSSQPGGQRLTLEWLATQRRIFTELVERSFRPPSAAKERPRGVPPPQRPSQPSPQQQPQEKQRRKASSPTLSTSSNSDNNNCVEDGEDVDFILVTKKKSKNKRSFRKARGGR